MPTTTSKFANSCIALCVAKICSTVGFTTISSFAMQILTDVVDRYVKYACSLLNFHMEDDQRDAPTLDDVYLTFRDLGVLVGDLEEYVQNVNPIPLDRRIPEFPVQKQSNLNFLKHGSKELLTRPDHIYGHLPAMYPDISEDDYVTSYMRTEHSSLMTTGSPPSRASSTGYELCIINDDRELTHSSTEEMENEYEKPAKQLNCVSMTSSGFLISLRDGKVAEPRLSAAFLTTAFNRVSSSRLTAVAAGKSDCRSKRKHNPSSPFSLSPKSPIDVATNEVFPTATTITSESPPIKKAKMLTTESSSVDKNTSTLKLPYHHDHCVMKPSVLNILDVEQTSSSDWSTVNNSSNNNNDTNNNNSSTKSLESESVVNYCGNSDSCWFSSSTRQHYPSNIIKTTKLHEPEKPTEKRHFDDELIERKLNPEFDKTTKLNVFRNVVNLNANDVDKSSSSNFVAENNNASSLTEPSLSSNSCNNSLGKIDGHHNGHGSNYNSDENEDDDTSSVSSSSSRKNNNKSNKEHRQDITNNNDIININNDKKNVISSEIVVTNVDDNQSVIDNGGITDQHEEGSSYNSATDDSDVVEMVNENIKKQEKSKKKKKKKNKKKKHKEKYDKSEKKNNKHKLKEKQHDDKTDPIRMRSKEDDHQVVTMKTEPKVPKLKLKLGPPPPCLQLSKFSATRSSAAKITTIKPVVLEKSSSSLLLSGASSYSVDEESKDVEISKISTLPNTSADVVVSGVQNKASDSMAAFDGKKIKLTVEPITIVNFKSKTMAFVANRQKSSYESKTEEKPSSSILSMATNKDAGTTSRFESSYYDENGNQIWLCPACGNQDDGSPMIACDDCDAWYHWLCVGISRAPDSGQWFCYSCQNNR